MNDLKLIEPHVKFEKEYYEMLRDWNQTGEILVPFVLQFDSSDFQKFITQICGFKEGIGVSDTFVSHSTFWLIDNKNKILGTVNIRHRLTDNLLIEGGHIGYGIRPSERRKGYATKILELSLIEANKLKIKRVLLTCDKENIGSAKTILRNNGQFDQENLHEGKTIKRYWIDIG